MDRSESYDAVVLDGISSTLVGKRVVLVDMLEAALKPSFQK
mgnify:FL=1